MQILPVFRGHYHDKVFLRCFSEILELKIIAIIFEQKLTQCVETGILTHMC